MEECGTNLRARGSLMELLVFRVETLGLVAVLLAAVAQIFGVGASKAGKKVGFLNNCFHERTCIGYLQGKKGKATVNSAFAPLVPDVNLVHEAGVKVADKLEAKLKVTFHANMFGRITSECRSLRRC